MTPDEPGPDLGSVRVPDDARDLLRDVEALRRERRARSRRQRAGRLLLTRRWQRYGLSGPLVLAVLAVVGVFGALMTLLRPSFPAGSGPEPLAAPAVAPGQVGGLLPDTPVLTPVRTTTTRALARPEVLVLVPVPCRCDDVLSGVVDQVRQATRDLRLLSTGSADPAGREVAALKTGPARGLVDSGVDLQGVLHRTYDPTPAAGPTVLFVDPDGVVADVVRDVQPGQRLDGPVSRLQNRTRP